MQYGKIEKERNNKIKYPDVYSDPIKDSINLGETTKIEIIGAVRLNPNLVLSDDKSVLDFIEAGITMKAILAAKDPATVLIIKAT